MFRWTLINIPVAVHQYTYTVRQVFSMKTLFSMDGQTIDPSAVLKLKRKRIVCIGAFGATRRYRLIPHRIRTTHSLLVPVVLLSLCLCTTTTASFVSKITNKRVKTVSPLSSSSGDKKDALHPNTITRRAALAAITSIAFFPSLTQADTTNDGSADSLERIRLGEGRWKPLHRSEMIISNVNDGPVTLISASFCTYAARFLIQYDRGVSSWWTELEAHLKTEQLNKEKLLGRAFGSFAKSLEQAFGTQSIEQLYDHFVTSYGKQPDAARQIALLFTLLPASQQPIFRLQNYYDEFNEIASISNNNAVKELNYKSPSSINTSYFGDNLTRLLPATFHITKQQRGNNSGFTIEPAVTLDETRVIGEEFGGGSVITTFGPLASVPLIRETPVYAPKTYALFGLAGATGCTITHALVIPLDGTFRSLFLAPGMSCCTLGHPCKTTLLTIDNNSPSCNSFENAGPNRPSGNSGSEQR